jgi:hypothetical protein
MLRTAEDRRENHFHNFATCLEAFKYHAIKCHTIEASIVATYVG